MNNYRETEIVSAEVVEITPEKAKHLLSINKGNRNISTKKALAYAKDMKAGNWKITHQGIAISTDGNIIDGQHRLSAILLAHKPIRCLLTTVKAVDNFGELTAIGQPIDIGKTRSIADITSERNKSVSLVRSLIRDFLPNGSVRSSEPLYVSACLDIIRESIDELFSVCPTAVRGLSQASIQGVMVIRHHQGYNWYNQYKNALLGKVDLLSPLWATWYARVQDTNVQSIRKDVNFRRLIQVPTWIVTDPTRDQTKRTLVIQKYDVHLQKMGDIVQEIFSPALIKSNK